jgi:hypothetical protein
MLGALGSPSSLTCALVALALTIGTPTGCVGRGGPTGSFQPRGVTTGHLTREYLRRQCCYLDTAASDQSSPTRAKVAYFTLWGAWRYWHAVALPIFCDTPVAEMQTSQDTGEPKFQ